MLIADVDIIPLTLTLCLLSLKYDLRRSTQQLINFYILTTLLLTTYNGQSRYQGTYS